MLSKKNPEQEKQDEVNGFVENNNLCFTVYNRGEVIPEEHIEKIFEKGFSTKQKSGKNSGLGLSIVQSIIKKYKGNVFFEPMADGNMFKVTLPLHSLK